MFRITVIGIELYVSIGQWKHSFWQKKVNFLIYMPFKVTILQWRSEGC